ncbi:MAG: ABC transporter ATP-binding protein [Candidatus Caccosoma sp.]|nr:ABC transporter ATP-binding protein [Candidatus Caccosoma sp.]
MKRKVNIHTLKRIFKYLKSNTLFLILSLLLAIFSVASTLIVPILFGKAIDYIIEENNVDFVKISEILLYCGISIIVGALAQWLMGIINNKITYKIVKDIRNDAFNKILILPLSYIDNHSYGEIVSKVITDVDTFADGMLLGFTQLFTGIITILGTLVIMYIINPIIATVVVVLTPLSLLVANFIAKKTHSFFEKQASIRANQTALIDEMVNNLKVVEAFNYSSRALNRFDKINDELADASLKATFYSSLTNPITRFINSTIYALVCLSGALLVIKSPAIFTVGTLSIFLSYANQYTKPFNEISSVITELQNAFTCANRVLDLIDEKPQVREIANPVVLNDVKGNIELENVYFSYTSDRSLITNFNLNVKSGQKIAIVGPTGCGKTTLINLLMRFYDVNSGKICVENHDIRDCTRKSLRDSYGMVLQETWLKEGTIRENIIMGKENASEEEIINACKFAHSYNFIKQLPNGLDTIINEDGGMLSTGQKQLLCITRVMLCLPPMLILDEATSSIDTRTELKIQDAFNKLMNNKTSFIVAHRLSTIKNADLILVMKDGNIIEHGNHEELLDLKGFYYNLYNSQFSQ